MFDLLFKEATVIDGTGSPQRVTDVAVTAGRIVEVGRVSGAARETVDARGAWLTPGFVDIHTHYDGQACWDPTFSPSIYHGTTTVVMGNCGVGFAPLRPGKQGDLIDLMEGVEDIPGVVLSKGIDFRWETFPQYMDALDAMPHSIDYLVQMPHDPLRMYVMEDRALAGEEASTDDIAAIRDILRQALQAGAAGFSTGRTDNHRTAKGRNTPSSEAGLAELTGIAQAFAGLNRGVIQMVSDFDLLRGPQFFQSEFNLVEELARASGRPLSMTWLQRDPGGEQYQMIRQRLELAVSNGLPLYLQTAARGIGVIMGLDASSHPFMGFPSYRDIAALPLAERAAAMRQPERRARVLAETSVRLADDKTPIPPLVDILLEHIESISARMFPLGAVPNYEPRLTESFLYQARRGGRPALELIYDFLAEGDGRRLIYFPIFNYNDGSLNVVAQMLNHPRALAGLGDAGAHVGAICDASFTTFMLTHWGRDWPGSPLTVERAVEMMTSRNARYLGLRDRGRIALGQRADLNLIDSHRLGLPAPELVHDLPAGARRFVQKARGYVGTWVAGQQVVKYGKVTAARPGRLVRMR